MTIAATATTARNATPPATHAAAPTPFFGGACTGFADAALFFFLAILRPPFVFG
jgi:hypothetical protein